MKMNVYKVYLDDGYDAFKVVVPACSIEDATKYVSGNGEIIAIREYSDYRIDTYRLSKDLENLGYKVEDIDILTRLLYQVGLAEM